MLFFHHIAGFGIDIERCEQCGGAVRIIARIEDHQVIAAILQHVGLGWTEDRREQTRNDHEWQGADPKGHDGRLRGSGSDLVSSGPIPASSPALILAVSANVDGGASDTGGSGSGGPAAGSDMCQQGALFWAFDEFTSLGTFAAGVVRPAAGSVTAYFDAGAEPGEGVVNKNEYVTVAIAFPLNHGASWTR